MKISYLVPLYNKESYIIECIESILLEDNGQFKIEICIVDDGSTDNSLKIVQEKYGKNDKVKIAKFSSNKGKNAACNEAFKISTGDFICVFGADDVVVPGRTNKLLQMSLSNDKKAVYGGLIAKDEELKKELYKILPHKQDLYSITMGNGLSGGCCFIPKELCYGIFPIPENLKFEDWWISYNLVKDHNYSVLDEHVTIYRIGTQNDCGFYGGDIYQNIKRDYVRHFDCLNRFLMISEDNPFIQKSLDLRNAFLGKRVNKILYLTPFDSFSIKIFLYKVFGARLICKLQNLYQSFKKF